MSVTVRTVASMTATLAVINAYTETMVRELWPTPPGEPTEPGVPDFARWGEAAPFVAQSEYLHSKMCTLSLDIDTFGADVGDHVVVNWIVNRLAGTGLTIADIVRALSVRLDWTNIDPDHTLEVMEAFDKARQSFTEACGAAQAATKALRDHTQFPR